MKSYGHSPESVEAKVDRRPTADDMLKRETWQYKSWRSALLPVGSIGSRAVSRTREGLPSLHSQTIHKAFYLNRLKEAQFRFYNNVSVYI